MSSYGVNLYNQYTRIPYPTASGIDVINGFISITKFTGDTDISPDDIDNAIFKKSASNTCLVFSPDGCLYICGFQKGNSTGYYSKVFFNPLSAKSRISFNDNWQSWNPVDYTYYGMYNNDYKYPSYFLCSYGNLGYGVNGSGYILYRDAFFLFVFDEQRRNK